MKKLSLLIIAFLSVFSGVNAQTINCNGEPETVTFGPVSCEMEGNLEYLSVTLMVSGFNSATCTASIFSLSNLPNDVTVDNGVDMPIVIGVNSYDFFEEGSYDLSIPSVGCEPVILNTTLLASNCDECLSSVELAPAVAPIPTLGQWGLILLSILVAIFGVTMISQKIKKNNSVIS